MVESATATVLSDAQRNELRTLARAGASTQKLARRCRIMLLVAEGLPNRTIARQVGVSRPTVLAVRSAFARGGVEALRHDQQRARKRRKLTADLEQKLIDTTLHSKPLGATHWSTRTLARHLGLSHMTVQRAWQSRELQPHRVEQFKLSNDPHFEDKVRDVVGLYLDPPDRALVLCVDEKSQIQALDRTAPLLPLRPGLPERRTHDYKRHGTTTLFAAFDILSGKVIGQCASRHRGKEFVKFLNQLEREVPPELDVHLIMDNYSIHKSPPVQRWLKPKKRRRFHFHFTPTGSSWLNQVERWFAEITNKRIRRGTFDSVAALEKAIYEYLAAWNQHPKPFAWNATADIILAKVERCKELRVTGH
jgi:transposase/DNA-binding CsgD family transcriptional regulator